MNALVMGAGFTGSSVAQFLAQQGWAVLVTNRSGQSIQGLEVPVVAYEMTESRQVNGLSPEQCERITHLLTTIAPTAAGTDPLWTGMMANHAHLAFPNLQWLGYLSTTGVYGDTQGAWVDELSPPQPGNARSQTRFTLEQQWLASGFPMHIFRLPGIYGPGRSTFERLRMGKAQNIIKPGHVFCRIHVDDIVQALYRSMIAPAPGSIYNVVDDEPCEPRELVLYAAKLMGIEPPDPILFHQAAFSPMGLSFWQECRRVSNQKIKQHLGVKLLYPTYREGLRAIFSAQ
ncbi:SDR family oxidoreductase [Lyngbya confervoides]|uniref:SDR family oxidoreductase n=1 Tax=Lyngbya confervoides BDU141951 TaxID=1574623 RepID=A0ABD4SYJ6_9CYAN|nr:SDR family oxidoreductase [Lyngbya confervoides]MCM1981440.1 SDR family oxidoreductase [Lyngbya confervoides BDU141951]